MAKRFRAELIQDDNSTATAIDIPFDVQKVFGARGRVPVRGTINGFPYRSSIFSMGGKPFMVVNKQLRAAAKVKAGDVVSVVMERDDEPRTVEAPPDLARALKANRVAQAAWDKSSYTHRKEYVQAIEDAKKPETRARRIDKAIAELTAKMKPKMNTDKHR